MQIVSLVSQALGVLGDPARAASKPAATAAFANSQTRGRKCPPLVPEFREIVRLRSDSAPIVDGKRRLTAAFQRVLPGSKLLASTRLGEIGVVRSEGEDSNLNFLLVFGVFHTKEEFVHAALQCEHPMDKLFGLDDLVIRCLFQCLTQGPEVIARDRIAFFTKWSARAAQLKEQEVSLHKSLPKDVAAVLKGKNLLLLEEMAASVGWADTKVYRRCWKLEERSSAGQGKAVPEAGSDEPAWGPLLLSILATPCEPWAHLAVSAPQLVFRAIAFGNALYPFTTRRQRC